ncbi:hypothetical protein HPP92_024309, partial [Vanilla planifolia]
MSNNPISPYNNPPYGHRCAIFGYETEAVKGFGVSGEVSAAIAGGGSFDDAWYGSDADAVRFGDLHDRLHDDALGAGIDDFSVRLRLRFEYVRVVEGDAWPGLFACSAEEVIEGDS